jgi:hypothetical protein
MLSICLQEKWSFDLFIIWNGTICLKEKKMSFDLFIMWNGNEQDVRIKVY